METFDIKSLRKKQLVWMNVTILLAYGVFLYFLFVQQMPINKINIFIGAFLIVSSFLQIIPKWPGLNFIDWINQIREYEAQKLGKQIRTSKILGNVLNIFLGVFLIFVSRDMSTNTMSDNSNMLPIMLFILVIVVIILNVSMLSHMRKVDTKSPEELKGYFVREYGVGLVVGLIAGIVIFIIILASILMFV